MAVFSDGTGDDVANATTLTGFIGGTLVELNDAIGDLITASGGNDSISAGSGGDTIYDYGGTSTTIDAGGGDDVVHLVTNFVSGSVAGNIGSDTLSLNGSYQLSNLTVTGFETLWTNGHTTTATAAQFESFDRIAHSGTFLDYQVWLTVAASGGATVLDLSDELVDGVPIGQLRSVFLQSSNDDEAITTGNGWDTIFSGGGNDSVVAGAGDDSINSGDGIDSLYGGDGNDTLYAWGTQGDSLDGGAGNDSITADSGASDTIAGGSGNDTISDLGGAATTLDAGDGDDLVTIRSFTSGSVLGGLGADTLTANTSVSLAGVTVSGFETLFTGGNANTVTATAAQFDSFDRIAETAGALGSLVRLTLAATGGPTNLDLSEELASGAPGGDPREARVTGSTDAETIATGDGNDTVSGEGGNDNITGGLGNDLLQGSAGFDTLIGGDGNDDLSGGADANSLDGGSGNDTLQGSGAQDTLIGGLGDDRINYRGSGPVTIDGGDGNDSVVIATTANPAVGSVVGGLGDDTLASEQIIGFPNTLSISGLDLTASSFENLHTRGMLITATAAQFDAFDQIALTPGFMGSVVTLALAATGGSTFVDLSDELANAAPIGNPREVAITGSTDAEVIGAGEGDDTLGGGDGNDLLYGQAGNDSIQGGAGNDTLHGGFGNETLDGGSGTGDWVSYGLVSTSVMVALYALNNQATGVDAGTDQLSNIENVAGGTNNDILVGNSVANFIQGNGGNDVVYTLDGDDTAFGGEGNDVLVLGVGNDSANSGEGDDYVYGGDGNDTIQGHEGVDVLLGEAGDDSIDAGYGDDYLYGGAGANILVGDNGNDIFISESTGDTLDGGSGHNYFYIFGTDGASINGGNDIDEFVGGSAASSDTFNGGSGQDYGYGGNGNDNLVGGGGDDVLIGQDGDDTLDGGSGVNLLWANDTGNDQIRVSVNDGLQTQVVEFFAAGGTDDVVRILGSTLTSFTDYETLLANVGTAVGDNLLVNAGSGAQLYLNLGANQTAIWFQGVSAYSLTASDFVFG